MRLATFNIESLDLPPKAGMPLEARAEVLRPALERLDADILCLQEINGQHVAGREERELLALDRLLAGTKYANYARVATTGPKGRGVADVHNLVTLSRYPMLSRRELLHELVAPPRHRLKTADPGRRRAAADPVRSRPSWSSISSCPAAACSRSSTCTCGRRWRPAYRARSSSRSCGSRWAAGPKATFLSALRRAAQALELRLLLEQMLEADAHKLIAVAGDFNAEDHEVPLRIVIGAEEDTGNGALAGRSLVLLDRAISQDRRWSVLHHGRREMLDHILVSRALHSRFRAADVHNETLGDELVGYAKHIRASASYHAPVVAEFSE